MKVNTNDNVVCRAMLALHKTVLTQRDIALEQPRNEASTAAMHTATNIIVDIAKAHVERGSLGDIDALPLTCMYALPLALQHIQQNPAAFFSPTDSPSETICKFLHAFEVRWKLEAMNNPQHA